MATIFNDFMATFVMKGQQSEILTSEQFDEISENFGIIVDADHEIPFSFYVKDFLNGKIEDDTYEHFNNNYAGFWDSPEEFMENFFEETGQLAEIEKVAPNIVNYIDYEKLARDYAYNGDIIFIWYRGGCYVFYGNY